MDSYTIRLETEEVEAMEREAEEQGFNSRTEYMRWILRNRPSVEKTTAETLSDEINELRERIEQLENDVEE